jgi:hypothetical protein
MGEFQSYQVPPTIPGPDAPSKAPAKPETPVERPAHIPEKFWKDGKIDTEGWSKSYSELEKKQSTQKPANDPPKPASGEKPEDKKVDEKPKDETLQVDKPVDEIYVPGITKSQSEQFSKEFLESGQLSDASYEALAKAGYPRAAVDAHIRGIQAEQGQQQTVISEMKALAGGDEGYSAMSEWMTAELTDTELQEYNEAVNSGKKGVIKAAVQGMASRYKEAVGSAPNLLGGSNNSTQAGERFESRAEVSAAMRDPRYKTDEAYRQRVAQKLSRSSV